MDDDIHRSATTADASVQHVVRIRTDRAHAERVETCLDEHEAAMAAWYEEDTTEARFECWFEQRAEADLFLAAMGGWLREECGGDGWRAEVESVPARDWQEAWKSFFRAERVSERIVVTPPWEAAGAPKAECVIVIDPGMSFGTGRHGTTRACLRLIDGLDPAFANKPFLDLGCGSGILSVAAARLGMHPVTAVDNDPEALANASENLERNGVQHLVQCTLADVAAFTPAQPFPVVAANILAEVLVRDRDAVIRCVDTRGPHALILSGILAAQYAAVCAAYLEAGFHEQQRAADGEWTSGRFARG